MVSVLKTVYAAAVVLSFIADIISNGRMISYCAERNTVLVWERWRYYLVPGLILPEYHRTAKAHEPDRIGIWAYVHVASFVSLVMSGVVFARL